VTRGRPVGMHASPAPSAPSAPSAFRPSLAFWSCLISNLEIRHDQNENENENEQERETETQRRCAAPSAFRGEVVRTRGTMAP